MEYLIIIIGFFLLMLVYFKIADRFNIIDKPNHRSAHKEITLRGGGVIFLIAFIFFLGSRFLVHNEKTVESAAPNYWIFGLGLAVICIISFLDDMMDLSTKIRLVFHFISVTLLLIFIHAFQLFPLWTIPICYILIIGILNAYNFMDGINGMSGLYSLVVLSSLFYVNEYLINFVERDFIVFPLLASLVFLFFNFRKKAKCFLGDIGSMGIAFWVTALFALLMIKTGEYKWVLFLAVYGIDSILTIMERLKLRENIFDAHRRHLYQLFANEKKISHLVISFFYAFIQLIVNVIVITTTWPDWLVFLVILLPAILLYLFIKVKIKRQILISNKIE